MLIFLLKLLLAIVCVLLGILLLTVIIPIHIRFWADLREEEKQVNAAASLYFGLVKIRVFTEFEFLQANLVFGGIRIPVFKKALSDLGRGPKKKPKAKTEKKADKPKKKSGLAFREWLGLSKKVFPRLLRPIRFRRFCCDLRVGFSNPAATGMFIGMYAALKYTLKKIERLNIVADFEKQGVFGTIDIDASIHLICFISTFLFAYKHYRLYIRKKHGGKSG